jgi:hypothetical protein
MKEQQFNVLATAAEALLGSEVIVMKRNFAGLLEEVPYKLVGLNPKGCGKIPRVGLEPEEDDMDYAPRALLVRNGGGELLDVFPLGLVVNAIQSGGRLWRNYFDQPRFQTT